MALQLFELSKDVEYVDIDVSRVPYTFSLKLADKTFIFTVKYNEAGNFFTADLFDANSNVLAFGEIIRYGRPLFNVVEDERFPIPVIIPVCLGSDGVAEVTKENLGKEIKLYIYERKVS